MSNYTFGPGDQAVVHCQTGRIYLGEIASISGEWIKMQGALEIIMTVTAHGQMALQLKAPDFANEAMPLCVKGCMGYAVDDLDPLAKSQAEKFIEEAAQARSARKAGLVVPGAEGFPLGGRR